VLCSLVLHHVNYRITDRLNYWEILAKTRVESLVATGVLQCVNNHVCVQPAFYGGYLPAT